MNVASQERVGAFVDSFDGHVALAVGRADTTATLWGEPIQKVYALWIEKMAGVAREVLAPEIFDILFNRLGSALEGWEEQAEGQLR